VLSKIETEKKSTFKRAELFLGVRVGMLENLHRSCGLDGTAGKNK
jgi:hypothetical protein